MSKPILIGPVLELRHGRVRPPSSPTPVVVQKYGGTLLRSSDGRDAVVEQIRRTRAAGHPIVVVASAMGRAGEPYATDTLLGLASEIDASIDPRTRDLLASCGEVISTALLAHLLSHAGFPAVPLTGRDAGIVTDDRFGDANVVEVQPLRVLRALKVGQIPVVAGFQGRTAAGDVTTLGRGGSDTSAVALAAALGAAVEVFKDVDGMMTADPRVVPGARTIPRMSYADAALAGRLGARVLHPRAAETAAAHCVPLRVRSLLSCPGSGTEIVALSDEVADILMVVNSSTPPSFGRISVVGSGLRVLPDPLRVGSQALLAAGLAPPNLASDADAGAISWLVPIDSIEVATRALHRVFVDERISQAKRSPSMALSVA